MKIQRKLMIEVEYMNDGWNLIICNSKRYMSTLQSFWRMHIYWLEWACELSWLRLSLKAWDIQSVTGLSHVLSTYFVLCGFALLFCILDRPTDQYPIKTGRIKRRNHKQIGKFWMFVGNMQCKYWRQTEGINSIEIMQRCKNYI